MHKHAYLRADGRYDLYDVEPVTVTAADYAALKKAEELEARQEQLHAERAKIDAELADVTTQLAALRKTTVESTDALTAAPSSNTDDGKRRKW